MMPLPRFRTFALGAAVMASLLGFGAKGEASWPPGCRGFGGFHRAWCPPSYGFGYRYQTYRVSAFTSYNYAGWCHRPYIAPRFNCAPRVHFRPRFYCPPTFCAPTFCAPTFCAPTFCAPTFCEPLCVDPFPTVYETPVYYPPVVHFDTPTVRYQPVLQSTYLANSSAQVPGQRAGSSEVSMLTVSSTDEMSRNQSGSVRSKLGRFVADKQPDLWLATAGELIDGMVRHGELDLALDACRVVLEKNPRAGDIQLRVALLSIEKSSAQSMAEQLATALEAGSVLEGARLPEGSLRDYLRTVLVGSLDSQLDRLAQEASSMDSSSLLGIAALLHLDGQTERAREFARATEALPSPALRNLATFLAQ